MEKTYLAAQIPQRTNSIWSSLATLSFYFCTFAVLLARKWCKDKASFLIYQIFHCFFAKNFSEPYFFAPRVPMLFVSIILPDCGCKVTANFSNFQMFLTFFSPVFREWFCMSLSISYLQDEKLLKNFNNEVKGGGESILYIGIRYLGILRKDE